MFSFFKILKCGIIAVIVTNLQPSEDRLGDFGKCLSGRQLVLKALPCSVFPTASVPHLRIVLPSAMTFVKPD